MKESNAYRDLAEKLIFRDAWDEVRVTDSLLSWVRFIFTEEEAELLCGLFYTPAPVRVISRRVKRPVKEIKPILESLSDRILIVGATIKGIKVYSLLPLWPGMFECQMNRSRSEGGDEAFFNEFARHYEEVVTEYMDWMQPKIESNDVRLMRVIPVHTSLERVQGVIPLDTDKFLEVVDRNNSFCLLAACACRHEREMLGKGCGRAIDNVCSVMGIVADWCIEKGIARRVSKEEFLEAKARGTEAGLVHVTDNLQDPVTFCSCCSCCCGALRPMKKYNIPTRLARSHFESVVDGNICIGCEACTDICPMGAIAVRDEQASIDYVRCIGCGLCIGECEQKALSLREKEGHKPPSENAFAFFSERYEEMKGDGEPSFVPRLSRGIGRMLGNHSRITVSGPGYKPRV